MAVIDLSKNTRPLAGVVRATNRDDLVIGSVFADTIEGRRGHDEINGGAGADFLRGGAGNDVLNGGFGADHLYGGNGDDTLAGGAGTDHLDGGEGSDTVDYTENRQTVLIDLAAGSARFPGQRWADETLISIENALGGSGDDIMLGDRNANTFRGNAGDDVLRGGFGGDRLFGGAGDDLLEGGAGTDHLDGGGGNDNVDYSENTQPVRIDLVAGIASFPGQRWANETLVDIESAIGGSGNDTMIGNDEANTFQGGAGDDVLRGGGGNDVLSGGLIERLVFPIEWGGEHDPYPTTPDDGRDFIGGGPGIDTVVYRDIEVELLPYIEDWISPNLNVNLVTGLVEAEEPGQPEDVLRSIENVTTGNGDDTIVGSDAANVIYCGNGTNVVRGGGGNDVIQGGTYVLEDWGSNRSGDALYGGAGNDIIHGNGSLERYQIYEHEDLTYSRDYLNGGRGDDVLFAGLGFNMMVGGIGADTFCFTEEQIDVGYGVQDGLVSAIGQFGAIRDFDAGDGDKIRIETTSDHGDAELRFVGMQDLESSDVLEVGYVTEVDENGATDTIVGMKFRQNDKSDGHNEFVEMSIVLEGYTGPLDANDFVFV